MSFDCIIFDVCLSFVMHMQLFSCLFFLTWAPQEGARLPHGRTRFEVSVSTVMAFKAKRAGAVNYCMAM